jgi:hypothetical protein
MFVCCECFVCCAVRTKGKSQDNQDKELCMKLKETTKNFPPGGWMSVCSESFVLSGRGLRDGPIPRSEELHRLRCVLECELETWRTRRPWAALGCCTKINT